MELVNTLISCTWTSAAMLWFNLKMNQIEDPQKVIKFVRGNVVYAILITAFTIFFPNRSVDASVVANVSFYIISMLIFSKRSIFCSFIEVMYTFLIQVLANIMFAIIYIYIMKKSIEEFSQSTIDNILFLLLVLLLYEAFRNNLGKLLFRLRDSVLVKHRLTMTIVTAYILIIAVWLLVAVNIMMYKITDIFWLISSLVLVLIAVFIGFTIIEQRNKFIELKNVASTDELTGTMNRKAGLDYLKNMMETAKKKEQCFNICYLDINNLKVVNDNLGHLYGDQMICHIISVIQQNINTNNQIIRMGGDEFLIVFFSLSQAEIKEIMEKIKVIIADEKPVPLKEYPISYSYGIAEYTVKSKQTTPMDLITSADQEMYQYKMKYKAQRSQA